ncbi:MAG: septation protein SpoVG family protein [Candidatus Auribacterota bacterium]|jgi:stage V sporulation protein G|nr:septation protein SpoVG family protein [Candidatus Auribacterota bacterium]
MMEITEIKIYPKRLGSDKKLKAFVTITIDDAFVIRDIKVIEGKTGLFVAMPSAKITSSCPECGKKNAVRDNFCSNCGVSLQALHEQHVQSDEEEHRDIAHPINKETRQYLHRMIIDEYHKVAESSDQYSDYDRSYHDE